MYINACVYERILASILCMYVHMYVFMYVCMRKSDSFCYPAIALMIRDSKTFGCRCAKLGNISNIVCLAPQQVPEYGIIPDKKKSSVKPQMHVT